ncbi:MAG: winged helix-turn-helix transcriptional regulator [Thermoplasmata archaeon]|jgi:DNA-binding Lrp family transcriptional regulator|nr:winged helix-turn-helix transcriptional regulator [Euryarchaeota archaeon]MVT35662.1 winged helix-turn-helix transcriptional regulator [Euryarchaeota archaeon]
MKISKLDIDIINLINENSKLSLRTIAKKVNSTVPTVKKRIKILEKNGIIKGYFTIFNPYPLSIYKDIFILYTGEDKKLFKNFMEMDGVKRIFKIEERRLILIFVYKEYKEILEFMKFLEKNGVEYEKFSVLEEPLLKNEIITEMNERIYCDYCGKEIKEKPIIKRIDGEEKYFCCSTCKNEYIKRRKRLRSLGHP